MRCFLRTVIPIALFWTGASPVTAQPQGSAQAGPASAAVPNASSGEAGARAVDVSGLGVCFRRVPPYPIEARRGDLEGDSAITFVVDPGGMPQAPALSRSSGHRVLDRAAVDHVAGCIARFGASGPQPLPPGRYAFVMVWRLE